MHKKFPLPGNLPLNGHHLAIQTPGRSSKMSFLCLAFLSVVTLLDKALSCNFNGPKRVQTEDLVSSSLNNCLDWTC